MAELKRMARRLGEVALAVLLVPQLLVFFYGFSSLFYGGRPITMLETYAVFGLMLSRVSAPWLVLVAVGLRAVAGRWRWWLVVAAALAAGAVWVVALNALVYPFFSYVRVLFPVAFCFVGWAAYELGRAGYEREMKGGGD